MVMHAGAAPFWRERASISSQIIKAAVLLAIVMVMLFPFVYVLSVSLSSERDLQCANVALIPPHPTLLAYQTILQGGVVKAGRIGDWAYRLLGLLLVLTRSGPTMGSWPPHAREGPR